MVVLAICTVARGAEISSLRRDGISWVRPDGTQVRTERFNPIGALGTFGADLLRSLRGFLILFPARKNKQATPTWVPVISGTVIALLAEHLEWLDVHVSGEGGALFPARKPYRVDGARRYRPSTTSAMSPDAFRKLIRLALEECCGLNPDQAKEFGTHSLRIGAIELLRQKGVPAAVRQQLGVGCLRHPPLPTYSCQWVRNSTYCAVSSINLADTKLVSLPCNYSLIMI